MIDRELSNLEYSAKMTLNLDKYEPTINVIYNNDTIFDISLLAREDLMLTVGNNWLNILKDLLREEYKLNGSTDEFDEFINFIRLCHDM